MGAQSFDEAIACMKRMRNPVRQTFAAQWINYRWHGAPEPSVPDGMRGHEASALIENMGGHRARRRFKLPAPEDSW